MRKFSLARQQLFIDFVVERNNWSIATFGPGKCTKGIIEHIKLDLQEIEEEPLDLFEWIDVMNLALDGYFRHGGKPVQLLAMLWVKLSICKSRKYPKPKSEDEPSEHIR